jgi:integrase
VIARLPGFSYDGRKKTARFVIYVPGERGKARRIRTAHGVTRDEALRLYAQFREEILTPSIEPRRRGDAVPTFAEFISQYWDKIAGSVSPRTARNYRYTLNAHLLPTFGSTPLDRITSATVQDFVAALRADGLSASSIGDYVRTLKVFLNQAVNREVIDAFPLRRKLTLPKEEKLRLELSPEERLRFLAAFDDERGFRAYLARNRASGKVVASSRFRSPRVFGGGIRPDGRAAEIYFSRLRAMRPLFVVALETGLRKGDLLALRWESVDLASGWIRLETRKTGQEVVLPISSACREALLECRAKPVASGRIFCDDLGKPLSETRVKKYFKIAKELAGVMRRFRFHDLRHTFGSNLASRGVSLQVIAKAMGHSSTQMTERYARPSREALEEVRRALDAGSKTLPSGNPSR